MVRCQVGVIERLALIYADLRQPAVIHDGAETVGYSERALR